jgi:hypothetical protein
MCTWEFRHAETGGICRATFAQQFLEIDVVEECVEDDDDHCDDWHYNTADELSKHGTLRTFCASKEVAYRELRLHCGEADLREIAG